MKTNLEYMMSQFEKMKKYVILYFVLFTFPISLIHQARVIRTHAKIGGVPVPFDLKIIFRGYIK